MRNGWKRLISGPSFETRLSAAPQDEVGACSTAACPDLMVRSPPTGAKRGPMAPAGVSNHGPQAQNYALTSCRWNET
jgi:hypothetical protein